MIHKEVLKRLQITEVNQGSYSAAWFGSGKEAITSLSPIDGSVLAKVSLTSKEDYERTVESAVLTFKRWRMYPAPKRGEIIRQIGIALRQHKEDLATLISLECGKIYSESLGEVQEAIDVADFAVGLSRQLYGLTMHSERPEHRMYEQWHPLGCVAVITAFNFPLAVWAWNAFIAAVCGDTIVWKPSEETPLIAIAATKICEQVLASHSFEGVFSLINGTGKDLGQDMAKDARFPLVSATGSCAMGRSVAQTVAARLGRSLLELGGNNAVIILNDADLELAAKSVFFGAAGTAGQRCTTTRRVFVQKDVLAEFTAKLVARYTKLVIGNPLDSKTVVGPLINSRAVQAFEAAIKRVSQEGGSIKFGGSVKSGCYVTPTIVLAHEGMPLLQEETFAPIVYVLSIDDLDHGIRLNNSVAQGLSSAIFTDSLRAAERFLSTGGSDCGIANVNIGTSGAEIGGAFGGEKDTGGGRESGSDSWKAYMRRQTNTINWGSELPLAQGVTFGEG